MRVQVPLSAQTKDASGNPPGLRVHRFLLRPLWATLEVAREGALTRLLLELTRLATHMWRNGIRAALRSLCPQGRAGSTPVMCTPAPGVAYVILGWGFPLSPDAPVLRARLTSPDPADSIGTATPWGCSQVGQGSVLITRRSWVQVPAPLL